MRTDTSVTIRREAYQPYPFRIPTVELTFDLDPARTEVTARYRVERCQPGDGSALVLQGESLELLDVQVDGQPWPPARVRHDDDSLTLLELPDQAWITLRGQCRPADNTTLMGLYVSNDVFFTQCEAEGFRRITWFADRPDVMSVYTVTLRADAERYPVLLSNGNLLEQGRLPDGRLQAIWHDPFPKPCYLFALVAGRLGVREKTLTTRSGRRVLLQVYSDPGNEARTDWALQSLERSLRWDEQRFNLELDLDRFMIVAARDFNMGAMENKGLNIFNAAYVLADPETATDANYRAIEAVIGHEYFHNWTGNRVTCRDWFQLSLKEGLTVFRDQEFTADMMALALAERSTLADASALARAQHSARAVKRIDDVLALRAAQFPEDAGPMAHPIRPESYQEIGNFYTATIYEKGAEVIRMQHTLLGEAGFQAGMAEYFRRHDGQAVTCDDFVAAMESVYVQHHPGRNLQQFREWYRQAGTPRVEVDLRHDAEQQTCTLTLTQSNPAVGIERLQAGLDKPPLHIPFAIGLLQRDGKPIRLRLDPADHDGADTVVLELTERQASWTFHQIAEPPVPSLLRDFSAPVHVVYDATAAELAILLAHDSNPFTRWEAGQTLASRHLLASAQALAQGQPAPAAHAVVDAWRAVVSDPAVDAAWRARALALPSERLLAERLHPIDPQALATARDTLQRALGLALREHWQALFHSEATPGAYSPDPQSAGQRDLRHLALGYWLASQDPLAVQAAARLYQQAGNMTERVAALSALLNYAPEHADTAAALQHFHATWHDDPLVIDKWFALQATARGTTLAHIQGLACHPAFTLRNPNRARALVFQFCLNHPRGFHATDGSGYAWWVEQVLALDAINPEIAARLARALEQFQRYASPWREAMHAALSRVHQHPTLSRNVHEIVAKALEISA